MKIKLQLFIKIIIKKISILNFLVWYLINKVGQDNNLDLFNN